MAVIIAVLQEDSYCQQGTLALGSRQVAAPCNMAQGEFVVFGSSCFDLM